MPLTLEQRRQLAVDYADSTWLTRPEPEPPTPADRVRTALEELARLCATPDAVADYLLDRQCYGLQRDGDSCPVYIWLREDIGVEANVGSCVVCVDDQEINTPKQIGSFVLRFDDGKYPALVARTV
jgi:hypothetical protein